MDEIDCEILERLQLDGRMTLSELSSQLHLSRTSVTERIRRLQDDSILEGFAARVSTAKVGRPILVWIQISDLQMPCRKFEDRIQEFSDVLECHRVTGTVSYVMKAAVSSMEALEALVDCLITFGKVNTSIVLSTPVAHRIVLPPDPVAK